MQKEHNSDESDTSSGKGSTENSVLSELNDSSRKPVGEDVDTDNDESKSEDESVLAKINGPAENNKDQKDT